MYANETDDEIRATSCFIISDLRKAILLDTTDEITTSTVDVSFFGQDYNNHKMSLKKEEVRE